MAALTFRVPWRGPWRTIAGEALYADSLNASIATGTGPQPHDWDAMAAQAVAVDAVRILDVLCRTDAALVRVPSGTASGNGRWLARSRRQG